MEADIHIHGTFKIREGDFIVKGNFTLTFNIAPAEGAIALGKTSFNGQVGVAMNDSVGPITGGNGGPYTFDVPDPTQIPPGVTLGTDGSVTGTPTKDGTFTTGVTVADSDG